MLGPALVSVLFAGALTTQSGGVASADEGSNDHTALLVVSPTGNLASSGRSCTSARYSTIQSAVDVAPSGATVAVCPGTYDEDVVVSAPLTLLGWYAVIEGTSRSNGTCDEVGPKGPASVPCLAGVTIKSSHVEIAGFTVKGAIGEGILATGSPKAGSITDVGINYNRVVGNNIGGIPPTPNSPYPPCSAMGQIPGDCGEGIHLMGVSDSTISYNLSMANEGGVLLTDEFGPTHGNAVESNVITRNQFDCGITVPGHNPAALDSNGNRMPGVAGVYDNIIRRNWVTDNGLQGEGAGVLFANAGPGTASYDNLVAENYLAGNQLSGVTMHAHTLGPGQFEDLNGNRVAENLIGENNVGSTVAGPGDALDGPPAQDFQTTGILVFSGSVPVHASIVGNRLFNDKYGVWLGINGNVKASLDDNTFLQVTVPVFTFS